MIGGRISNGNGVVANCGMLQRVSFAACSFVLASLVFAAAGQADPCSDNSKLAPELGTFYSKLYGVESKQRKEPVRILHLGDSRLDADSISGFLASRFQGRFGFAGRGRFPAGKPSFTFQRLNYQIQASANWKVDSSMVPATPGPFGVSGYRLTSAEPEAFVHMRSMLDVHMNRILIDILRQPDGGSFIVSLDGRVSKPYSTKSESGTVEHDQIVIENEDAQGVWLEVVGDGPVSVLAFGGEGTSGGVMYEAHGVLGASLAVMDRWDAEVVAEELKAMSPDLIILSFGLAEAFDQSLDAAAFEKLLTRQIRFLKKSAGGAPVLVVSALESSDIPSWARDYDDFHQKLECKELSAEERSQYAALLQRRAPELARQYPPFSLATVQSIQRKVAHAEGVQFFDSQQAMGGVCSFGRWVAERPALAFDDGFTLTPAGNARFGEKVFGQLMSSYKAYSECRAQSGS